MLLPFRAGIDAPEDEPIAAPGGDKPAPADESGDDWPFVVKVALVGVVVAVIVAWLRFSRGRNGAGYEKANA